MLDDDIVTVPAGWYPDPMGLPQLRWWDNYAWTEFTSAARTPLVMQDEPRLAYADDDLPSRRSQRERTEASDGRAKKDTPADLASTLKQLEPPKPQNIEPDQPAPAAEATPAAEPQASFSTPENNQSANAQSGDQVPQQAQQQAAADPFAEFLAQPTPQQNSAGQSSTAGDSQFTEDRGSQNQAADRESFDQQSYAQQPFEQQPFEQQPFEQQPFEQHSAFGHASRGSQTGLPDQFAQQTGAYDARQNNPQFGYGQQRMGVHAPLAYTPFVWIIAMIPLIQLVGILLIVSAVDVSMAMPFLLVILLGPYVVGIPLAIADRRQLLRVGHQHPAHWFWSLFSPPAYLVVRAVASTREQGKGLTPLLVWASLSLLQLASIIVVPGILISAMPAVFSAEVEESVEANSLLANRELAVSCPATPPVQIGGTFNCTGVLAETGETVGIVVRLQRANGWIDWRVYGMVWDTSNTSGAAPGGTGTFVPPSETDTTVDGEPVDGEAVEGKVVTP